MHRDYNIRFKLNQKIPFILRNVENYDLHLIMHERGKFNFKINIIPNGLGKYVSFNINKKLMCIDSFQFLRSSLDSVVQILSILPKKFIQRYQIQLSKNDFIPIHGFEKFKEKLPSKERFYSSLMGKKISDKQHDLVLKVWEKFEIKTMKDYHGLYLKCDVLLAEVFEQQLTKLWVMPKSLFEST